MLPACCQSWRQIELDCVCIWTVVQMLMLSEFDVVQDNTTRQKSGECLTTLVRSMLPFCALWQLPGPMWFAALIARPAMLANFSSKDVHYVQFASVLQARQWSGDHVLSM